jgi:hypothetical protein
MKISSCWLRRHVAGGLVLLLAMPFAESAAALPLKALGGKQPQSESSVQDQPKGSDGPTGNSAPVASRTGETYPDNPGPARSEVADQSAKSGTPQAQDGTPKPVGTAAAPYEKTTGVAASRPAGAVIAPAKQRRARYFLIRISVVVGAAVAVGTVVALSHGSPSRPN